MVIFRFLMAESPQGSVLCPRLFAEYAEDVSLIFDRHDLRHHLFTYRGWRPHDAAVIVRQLEFRIADVADWCAVKRL